MTNLHINWTEVGGKTLTPFSISLPEQCRNDEAKEFARNCLA